MGLSSVVTETSNSTSEPAGAAEAERLHHVGVTLAHQRRFDEASALFRDAAAADPTRAESVRFLAQAYADAGRLEEAEAAWIRYAGLCPDLAAAHRHLGNLRKRMEKLDPAIESLQQAVKLDDQTAANHLDLGVVLSQAKKFPDAKRAFLHCLELEPQHYDAHLNLGMLCQQMGEHAPALDYLRKAIELRPEEPTGPNNLGVVLSEQGKFDEAITCFEEMLARRPEYFMGWNNLGNSRRALGDLDGALEALRKAVEMKPDYAEAYNNMGIVYAQKEQLDRATESYDKALLLRPDYPEAHANRGLVYLLMGNFREGWADYEWRWQGGQGNKRRKYPGKLWDGSPLTGRRILLYYEQGIGDTFQFIRYAKELKNRGATVIFECQRSTKELLSRTPGIDELVVRGEKLPPFDLYAPLLALPGLFQTHLDNLPRRIPYLFTDQALTWEWKRRLDQIDGFKVGIVWQGNPDYKGDRNRSIALSSFAPLANVPGITLISLQHNFGVDQIKKLDGLFPIIDFENVGSDADGWLRTAAIIANLDLVVTADTAVAHLAGAMGMPAWILIPTSPDWRWLMDREDTSWYPTVRLLRQTRTGDWDEVLARIAEELRQRFLASGKTMRSPASDIDQLEAGELLRKAGTHLAKNELREAQSLLEQAVRRDPSNAAAHQDLGVVYAKQGRLREGLTCFRRALELAPDSPGLYANMGLACYHAGQFEESVSHLRKAIWLGSGSADTHKNLARALTEIPDPVGAEEAYWAALRLKPDDAEAHYHLARVMLMAGKFEQGWLEFEWRWRWRKAPKRELAQPRWTGQNIEGKRVLVVAEQDTRDTIQFARYANLITDQGGTVVLECQAPLAKLMAGCLGVGQAIALGEAIPPHDLQVALLSLPAILGTTLQTVPAARPYLGISSQMLDGWCACVQELAGTSIGIALDEDSVSPAAQGASPLSRGLLRRLSGLAGIALVKLRSPAKADLQSEPVKARLEPDGDSLSILGPLPDDPADGWVAVAAAIRGLDVLIAVDNTIAHIAGAMGVPTWVALPISPEPRWLLNRSDSPWYPTMRLFRQRHQGDWDEVANRIAEAVVTNLRLRSPGSSA
jgi:tetratricopeptide (TPR) repeat protein